MARDGPIFKNEAATAWLNGAQAATIRKMIMAMAVATCNPTTKAR